MIRFTGSGPRPRIAPRGDAWSDTAEVIATSVDALVPASSLPSGTLVYVLEPQSRWPGLLSAFGKQLVPRHARCTALMLAGYVDIGAEADRTSRLDLVFGRVP